MPHEFTVEDRDGKEHEYRVTPFTTSEAIRMAQDLLKVSSGPLGEALGSFARDQLMGNDTSFQEALESGAEKIEGAENMDWGDAIFKLASSARFDEIALRLCKHVLRDDSKELKKKATFDQVYQRNFGELVEVLVEVVKYNGFLPTSDTSGIIERLTSIARRVQIGKPTGASGKKENEPKESATGSSSDLLHTTD